MTPIALKRKLKKGLILLYFIKKNKTSIPSDLNILAKNQLSS
jgi:hypothetical protein